MKCCLLSFLLLSCIDNQEQAPIKPPKKTQEQHYPYKGQDMTFQEWTKVIRERKSGLPKQEVVVSAPSADIWLTDLHQSDEQKPLLRRTRSYSNLNQLGAF